jgi:hypothetical protein
MAAHPGSRGVALSHGSVPSFVRLQCLPGEIYLTTDVATEMCPTRICVALLLAEFALVSRRPRLALLTERLAGNGVHC